MQPDLMPEVDHAFAACSQVLQHVVTGCLHSPARAGNPVPNAGEEVARLKE